MPSFQARPYQTAAVERLHASWAAGKRAPLIVAPTGAGKTEIAKMALEGAKQPMALVHTETLFDQTRRRAPRVHPYTPQSLLATGPAADRRRARLSAYDVCWVDEAHHYLLRWKGVLDQLTGLGVLVFGVTATPMRADGTALGDVYDDLIDTVKYSELVRDGFLCPCDVARSEISRSKQKKDKVRPDGVEAYVAQARRADGSWRPGIHFEVTREQCATASQRYNEFGIRSRVVDMDTGTDERRVIFDAYTAGDLDMLCSPTALAEGFDSPRAEVCVLRRSTDHVGDYLQRVGRVLRPFPGKQRALLIDICNASTKPSHGLPTDDRVYSLAGKGIRTVAEAEAEMAEEEAKDVLAPIGLQTVTSRYQLVRDTLLSRYRDIVATAEELGYKRGWVFHRFAQVTSLTLPAAMPSKYASVCKTCRHRVQKGEEIFWTAATGAMHPECWVQQLDEGAISIAADSIEKATEWKPSRGARKLLHDSSDIHGDDQIPF